jgi:hypothetical protein
MRAEPNKAWRRHACASQRLLQTTFAPAGAAPLRRVAHARLVRRYHTLKRTMKRLLLLIILSVMPCALSAQTVADAQLQATTKYPALAQQGSPLNAKFLALYNEAKQTNPTLLTDPNWPMILADRAAALPQPARQAPTAGTFEETKAPFEPQLKDTEATFKEFIAKGHPKPRDQFETREEYEARLPKPFDSSEVLYFEVTQEASYSYDIDKQRLTLVGGEFKNPDFREYKLTGLAPLAIHRKLSDTGRYEASNAFGKTVTVTKGYFYDYYLHLTNGKSLPATLKVPGRKSYDKSEQLTLSVTIQRDQAKEVAPRLAIVCGVRFVAYAKSAHECTLATTATIARPSDLAVFANGIDADLVSIHIIDKQTKEELARWRQ